MSNHIAEMFCKSLEETPEVFVYLISGRIYHSGSKILYDFENGVLGHLSTKEVIENDVAKDVDCINFISTDIEDIKKIHMSYISWLGWYKEEKSKKILDLANESLIEG